MHKRLALAAALLLTGCAGHRADAGNAGALLGPLHACETRAIELAGANLVVSANADGSTASIAVVSAPNRSSRSSAMATARAAFGPGHPDDTTVERPLKWGLVTRTDRCGRPAAAAALPPVR